MFSIMELHARLRPLSLSRVQVLELSQKEGAWAPDGVLVRFIDEGRTGLVTTDQLLHLPGNFHTLPPQAVEFIVCRVKPADNETEWNPKVSCLGFLYFVGFQNIFNPEYIQN